MSSKSMSVTTSPSLLADDLKAQGMEGADRCLPGDRADQFGQPQFHLRCRLPGKRDRENIRSRHALREEMRDASGDDPGLSGPRPGQDQERPLGAAYGFRLGLVEPVEDGG